MAVSAYIVDWIFWLQGVRSEKLAWSLVASLSAETPRARRSIRRDGGCRWIRGEVGAERRQLIAGAYRVPAEVKIKWHEARPFGGTTAASH